MAYCFMEFSLNRRDDAWFAALGRSCIHMTWSDRGAISLEVCSMCSCLYPYFFCSFAFIGTLLLSFRPFDLCY